MNWILVVLQATAAFSSHSHYTKYGWTPIGEFKTEKACIAASVKLAQASRGVMGVSNFQCLQRD